MLAGTGSDVGKSIIAAAFCRIFLQDGYHPAPFKAQNMALNSYATPEGLEIGRAQAVQAEAAGVPCHTDMNPLLLKPSSDHTSQVVLNGRPIGNRNAYEYFRREGREELRKEVHAAFDRLAARYNPVVMEGAGSISEINLRDSDLVNLPMAMHAGADVILVADIDRGGVFASVYGSVMLLRPEERKHIKGILINKFRGDVSILEPGLRMLEDKTDIPVTGVVPYFYLDLDEEDSLTERFQKKEKPGLIDLAVIRFPRISNFTDLAPLEALEEVSVRYVSSPAEFGNPDAVILPGTKNTISDLLWMRQNGLEARILKHSAQNKPVFGICGGYQMLGMEISDPTGEEYGGTVQGMGLLDTKTVFRPEKHRTRVHGTFGKMKGILKEMKGLPFEGYEIHMGETILDEHASGLITLENDSDTLQQGHPDGSQKENVYGCYVHGIFDSPEMSGGFLSALLKEKGYDPETVQAVDWKSYKEEQYDKLADIVRASLDMEEIYKIIGL